MRINLKKMKRSIISFLEYRENLETTSFIIFDYFIHMPSREIKLRDLWIIYSTFNFQSKFLSSQCLIIRDENKVWYKKKFITGLLGYRYHIKVLPEEIQSITIFWSSWVVRLIQYYFPFLPSFITFSTCSSNC